MGVRTIFIGGVHGVGKTYFCENLANRFDAEHITASKLIGRHSKHNTNKTVVDIQANQLILAQELRNHQTNCKTILLDGHFCLLNKISEIQNVPLETFEAIAPCALIIVMDNPEKISERLTVRDNHVHTIDSIKYLQSREIDRANFISQSLDVPIEFIRSSENLEVSFAKVRLYFASEEN